MSQKHPSNKPVTMLPVKIPADPVHLQRAITLLGNRTKADLQTKPRHELVELIGSYPSAEQAAIWKQALKQLHRQRTGES